MNRAEFTGRLTKDPELATTNSGINYCTFSIAVTRKRTNSNGEKLTDFFNVIAWRGLGENIYKYCNKGSKIYIAGELQNNVYEKEDGSKKYLTQIVANECEFLGTKRSEDSGEKVTNFTPVEENDLPF